MSAHAPSILHRPVIAPSDMKVLRRANLFEFIPDADIDALVPRLTCKQYARNQRLLERSGTGDGLVYVVLQGRVALFGRRRVRTSLLDVLGPADVFGDLAALDPAGVPVSAVALASTRVGVLPAEDLVAWIIGNPAVARRVLRTFAGRVRMSHDDLANRFAVEVSRRLAHVLLDMAARFGEHTEQGVRVQHDLTQEYLADLVGSTREGVNRVLARFVMRGWLGLENRSVVLRDVPAITRFLNGASVRASPGWSSRSWADSIY